MGKPLKIVVFVLVLTFLAVAAGAQSASSPASNQSMSNQPAMGQEQNPGMSSASMNKLAAEINHNLIMLPYYGVFDNLAYQIQGRTVILTGQVTNPSLKPDAERAVKKIEGVEKVVNKIEVLPPSPMDANIREQVRRAIYGFGPLFKYANRPNAPIRIIVKNARVTLEGVVDNENDKNLCTLKVNQVSSVLSVTNNLRVVKP